MAENKGEMLKNALLDLGLATIATNFPYGAEVLWGLLADKYFITGVQTAKQAAENLKADLENRGDGKYAIKNMKLITNASSMFYDLGNNTYATDWLPVGTLLRFKTTVNGEIRRNTVGFTNVWLDIDRDEEGKIGSVIGYYEVLVNGEVHRGRQFFVIASEILDPVFTIKEWRAVLQGPNLKFEYEYYYRYEATGTGLTERQGVLYYGNFVVGTLLLEEEEDIIFNVSPIGGGGAVRHIGDDISHVDSITGGNGADAGLPVATLPMIGRGGNGGHGGGGGGAPGFCKREIVYGNGMFNEIDLTASVGEMVPGTGGTGTAGTPGYHGGCIIFYGERSNNA